MSKRSFLRKSAVSLAATLGLGATAAFGQITLTGGTLTIGMRNIEASGVLRGEYYDRTAGDPPTAAFNSVDAIRAFQIAEEAAGVANMDADLKVNLDFNQDNAGWGGNPFHGLTVPEGAINFGSNDHTYAVWSGEIVVDAAAAGRYRFDSASDDGTVAFVDGQFIVRNNFYQGRTRRNFAFNLTEGAHPLVMAWYEGGGGANGTFWLYREGTGEKIINPGSPLPGITYRKVNYVTDTSKNNQSVTVNADSTIEVAQETAVPFGSLTLADGKTLTINSIAPVSFTGSKVGATGTLAVNSGVVTTGAITGGPITNFRKSGGGEVIATNISTPSGFTSSSTLQISGGTFTAKAATGPGATGALAHASSIGDAKILLDGGTFIGTPSNAYEVAGQQGRIGVTFFSGPSNERQIGPFPALTDPGGIDVAPLGLLTRSDGKTLDYAGAFAFDDDNPDFGHPNFNAVSGGHVGVDNLQTLGYGRATFTDSPDPFVGNSYTIGTWSDDGVTMWLDLDNDGKFEADAGELIHNANTFHAPRIDVSSATIPAGTYRMALGFYEGGGNAVHDFRIARGTQAAADYAELKANFKQINPADTTIISKISSILLTSNNEFTNPITVSGTSSGLQGTAGTKYSNVTLTNGSILTVGGPMSIGNTIIDGVGQINFNSSIDFGKLQPATAGSSFTFVKGGPADLNLQNTTAYNTLDSKATIGVASGRLLLNGALATPASPSSIGNANIRLGGGTLVTQGVFDITDSPGAANTLTEYVFRVGGNQTPLLNPIFAAAGLLNQTPERVLTLSGPISNYNDAFIQTRWGVQDNVESLWYGEMTFTTDPGTGNEYTFASKTDDGSVIYIDLNNDGDFTSNELVLNNNFYQGPTTRRGVATVPPGTHRVAIGFYEGGGGALADFKFGRGDIPLPDNAAYDDPLNFMLPIDPTNTSIATYRARTFTPVDVATPSFSTNAVEVTGNTTVDSLGASAFGPTTFRNTATVNFVRNGSKLASATVESGTGTIRNSVGANRVSVGDAGASAGATLAFTGNNMQVTGGLTGAGRVQLAEGTLEFTGSKVVSTSTGTLDIGGGTTMRFNSGPTGSFGAAGVTAVNNLGTLNAAAGVTDLSGATVTTPSVAAGLLGGRIEGDPPDLTTLPTVQTVDLRLSRAQTTDVGFFGGNHGSWVYRGEIRIPDTDGDGTPGPVAFAEQFDDFALLKIDGVEYINNNAWDQPHSSGQIEVADLEPDGQGTPGDGWFTFEARFGDIAGGVGPNSGFDLGFGIDTNPADGFDAKTDVGTNLPRATRSQYVEPVDNGTMNLFRFAPPPNFGHVQVAAGATLKVGALVNPNGVSLSAGSRLELHGATSKINASLLTQPGTPTAPTATIDVTDSALVLDYGAGDPNPSADTRSRIIAGRGAPGLLGTWDGKGITSSAAQADNSTLAVGYANNADLPLGAYTEFRGQPVDATSVLIRGTRIADANLDGVVNDDDVTIVGATFGMTTGAVWGLGDFTYDGAVNDDDVTLLGALYDPTATPIGGAPVALEGAVAAVPEPATWLMLTLGGLGAGLFGWRRRKS